MSIKVAIVEDDAPVREGIAFLLNASAGFSCAGTYANAEMALKQLPQQWPDVVLMDINLPKMSGVECVAKLKGANPKLQILMLTSYEDEELIFNSLENGASGYLIKQTPPAEILEAIDDVSKGGSPMSRSIARKVVQHFQKAKGQNETDSLSKREMEILTHLTKGLQYKEIADVLGISIGTVRTHLRSIYEKLHVRSRTEAVVKFLGNRS